MARTLRIALTGGIGSGKSAVARLLAEHGATVVDADKVAREIVEPGQPALEEIVKQFGREALHPDGTLNRPLLAEIVFKDRAQLERLNAITHPRIRERTRELMDAVPPGSVLVYDMPLLVEQGLTSGWDLVVVVDAPDEVRVERLVEHRGLAADDARARMAAQATREARNAAADLVIDNSGDLMALRVQVDALWEGLRIGAAAIGR